MKDKAPDTEKQNNLTISHIYLERLLIFFTVLSVAFTLIFLIHSFFQDISLFLLVHCGFSLVNEILMVFILQVFMKKNTKAGFHIRLVFFFLLINFGAAYLLQNHLFAPVILVFVFLQYVFTSILFEAYLSHDDFEKVCEGKAGSYLSTALAQDKYVAQDFVKNVSTVKSILFAVCLILVAVTFLMFIKNGHLSFSIYILCILTILFSYGNVQLFQVYENEIYYAFLGFEKVFDTRWIVYTFGLLFICACFILSQLFSSNQALIKFSWLLWLWNLFKKDPKPYEPKTPQSPVQSPMDFDSGEQIGKIVGDAYQPNLVLEAVLSVLKWVLIAAVVIGILIYIFKPVVTGKVSKGIREKHLMQLLKEFFSNVRNFFEQLFGYKFEKQAYASVSSRAFKFQIADLIQKSKKSKVKKQELDRLTKEFIKLIDWGEKKDIFYKKSYAPGEYTELLNSKFPSDNLITAGIIFEKALYSADLISKDEEDKYKFAIEDITGEETK